MNHLRARCATRPRPRRRDATARRRDATTARGLTTVRRRDSIRRGRRMENLRRQSVSDGPLSARKAANPSSARRASRGGRPSIGARRDAMRCERDAINGRWGNDGTWIRIRGARGGASRARASKTTENGDEETGASSRTRARDGGGGETRAKTRSYRDDAAKTRRREDARTRGRGRRARTRREGGCGEERARGETDGEAVRRRAIATTGSTRSSSAKSRRTSRATARRSSCTRDGPCSASPV